VDKSSLLHLQLLAAVLIHFIFVSSQDILTSSPHANEFLYTWILFSPVHDETQTIRTVRRFKAFDVFNIFLPVRV
jgi:hypothetical protein